MRVLTVFIIHLLMIHCEHGTAEEERYALHSTRCNCKRRQYCKPLSTGRLKCADCKAPNNRCENEKQCCSPLICDGGMFGYKWCTYAKSYYEKLSKLRTIPSTGATHSWAWKYVVDLVDTNGSSTWNATTSAVTTDLPQTISLETNLTETKSASTVTSPQPKTTSLLTTTEVA